MRNSIVRVIRITENTAQKYVELIHMIKKNTVKCGIILANIKALGGEDTGKAFDKSSIKTNFLILLLQPTGIAIT